MVKGRALGLLMTAIALIAVITTGSAEAVTVQGGNATEETVSSTDDNPYCSQTKQAETVQGEIIQEDKQEVVGQRAVGPTELSIITTDDGQQCIVLSAKRQNEVARQIYENTWENMIYPKECEYVYNTDAEKGRVPTFYGYTVDDLYCLTIIVYKEGGGDAYSDDTRLKIANVVINRLHSARFKETTIRALGLADGQYADLRKTGMVFPERATKNELERNAVFRAEQIAIRVLEGERVLPDNIVYQSEHILGDFIHCEQDGQYFCGIYNNPQK